MGAVRDWGGQVWARLDTLWADSAANLSVRKPLRFRLIDACRGSDYTIGRLCPYGGFAEFRGDISTAFEKKKFLSRAGALVA
jgi:hypothetical protein